MLSWNPETLQCLQPGVFRRWAGGVLEEGTSGRDVEDALDFMDTPSSSRLVALSCGLHPCGPAYTWCLMNAGAACCLPERPPPRPIPPSRKHMGSHGAWGHVGRPLASRTPVFIGPGPLGLTHAWSTSDHSPARKQTCPGPFPEGLCMAFSGHRGDQTSPVLRFSDFWAVNEQSKAEPERSWGRWTTHRLMSFSVALLWACSAIRSKVVCDPDRTPA